MKDGFRVIDSDLHVIETGEIYDNYLDEKYRDKIPRYLGWSPTNFPHWDVQGQMIPPWARSADVVGPQQYLDAPTEHMYKPVRERGYDAPSTVKAMDAEGIDIGIVYRTFAHMVVSIDDLEPAYATAYCAAFNDWLTDYCHTNPKRLKPSAIVSLHDPELAATEARRAVEKKGHVGVVLLPMPIKDRYFNSPECDVLWKEITRLNVPLAFHGTSGGASKDYVTNRFRGKPNFRTQNHASAFPLELMMAMSAMLVGGVLERFPHLRLGFLEGNCGWLPWWLHRLDDQWKKYGGGESIKLSARPSEYFQRQCFIGTDVDEELLKVVVDEIGDDNIVMSVDYPHADGPFPNGVKTFLDLPGVSLESKRKIMWGNCLRLYGFAEERVLAAD
ncbi:MAG TPA: amidohydrolase family protein [Candidatus Binatia bacterium]|nr:amidohydrolase family protein [Candidatus Binatia bacterium]